jgi:hypothetical protein
LLSGNQEECDLIEDDLMRLICLNKYTSQPCDEVSNVVNFECEYINTDELKKYIDKYNITGCCDEEREENPPLIRIGEFF